MTKKEQKTSPTNPTKVDEALVDNVSLAEVKNLPRWKTVEVELHELKDGKIQGYLICDGKPLMFWTQAYQNLEMTAAHASKILKKLYPGTQVVIISNSEMNEICPTFNDALKVKYKSNEYHFLTDEGYNRTILEVNTPGMKNREIAARIEQRKDEMASVFTKFKRGELTQPSSDFDIESFDTSKKGMQSLNGVRIRLQGMLAKQRHPSNPDTVRRKISMFRRDWKVMKGNDDMEENWRARETEDSKRILTGWYACGIYSFARGHLESEEQSRDIKEFYSACPELKPSHLPELIETTKQTKLLVAGDGA